jgi:hypothetical protein
VPPHGLVFGNPAHFVAYVCECGARLKDDGVCSSCSRGHQLGARLLVEVGS